MPAASQRTPPAAQPLSHMALAQAPEGAAPAPAAAAEPLYGGYTRFELELEVRLQMRATGTRKAPG